MKITFAFIACYLAAFILSLIPSEQDGHQLALVPHSGVMLGSTFLFGVSIGLLVAVCIVIRSKGPA